MQESVTLRSDELEHINLVFIVGSPRSGTTWLQRLLAAHPVVTTGQESEVILYVASQLRIWKREMEGARNGRRGIGLPCYFEESEFRSLLHSYLLQLLKPMTSGLSPGEIFLEKTPSHALYISEIMDFLPNSKIIHLLRDPRDVTASIVAASRGWGANWAPSNAGGAASMWVQHVAAVQMAKPHVPPSQFLEIRYETLSAETERTLQKIAEFLDITWDPTELARAIHANSFSESKSNGGTVIPVGGELAGTTGATVREPEGFVRKALVGAWKTELSAIDKLKVWIAVRKTMKEVGYRWTMPWTG
jgi:hypothetical protein